MVDVSRDIAVSTDRVWAVLADGWAYAGWVVGASHIRRVDAHWPLVGARIHHSVGTWPAVIDDTTEVTAIDVGKSIDLHARLWPAGAASVRIDLEPLNPTRTRVHMSEHIQAGPGKVLPQKVQALFLVPRNKETLSRLADLALRREG